MTALDPYVVLRLCLVGFYPGHCSIAVLSKRGLFAETNPRPGSTPPPNDSIKHTPNYQSSTHPTSQSATQTNKSAKLTTNAFVKHTSNGSGRAHQRSDPSIVLRVVDPAINTSGIDPSIVLSYVQWFQPLTTAISILASYFVHIVALQPQQLISFVPL